MQEIDFVMSDLSLEIIGDFAIVWLLSPKKSFSPAPIGGVSQFASQLPGHSLQVIGSCPSSLCHTFVRTRGGSVWAAPVCVRLCWTYLPQRASGLFDRRWPAFSFEQVHNICV